MALYLAPALQRLVQQVPNLSIELEERWPTEALEQLNEGIFDAVVTGQPEPNRLKGLEFRTFFSSPPLIALSASHWLAKRRQIPLPALQGEKLCVWDKDRFPGFGKPFLDA